MHIGKRIKEIMDAKRVSVISVANAIACERTNVYNICERKDISTSLLSKLSVILDHDFYAELSEELKNMKK